MYSLIAGKYILRDANKILGVPGILITSWGRARGGDVLETNLCQMKVWCMARYVIF